MPSVVRREASVLPKILPNLARVPFVSSIYFAASVASASLSRKQAVNVCSRRTGTSSASKHTKRILARSRTAKFTRSRLPTYRSTTFSAGVCPASHSALRGVSKKLSLGRKHGIEDISQGNFSSRSRAKEPTPCHALRNFFARCSERKAISGSAASLGNRNDSPA